MREGGAGFLPRLSESGSRKCSWRGVFSASFLCVVLVLVVFSGVPGPLGGGDQSGGLGLERALEA
jgi:hypothetical protein